MSVCEGARRELGGGGKLEPAPATREKQETVGGGSRGQCQGARHQARPAGRAASGGGAGRGTRGQPGWGDPPPNPPNSHSGPVIPLPQLTPQLQSPSGNITLSPLPKPTRARLPPQDPMIFFFFLKGPGGVGWLVDDEVSACTHRGFCLPWRVKPRLSERAPPQQALDPLC